MYARTGHKPGFLVQYQETILKFLNFNISGIVNIYLKPFHGLEINWNTLEKYLEFKFDCS